VSTHSAACPTRGEGDNQPPCPLTYRGDSKIKPLTYVSRVAEASFAQIVESLLIVDSRTEGMKLAEELSGLGNNGLCLLFARFEIEACRWNLQYIEEIVETTSLMTRVAPTVPTTA